jgi:dienelactone hydrolase
VRLTELRRLSARDSTAHGTDLLAAGGTVVGSMPRSSVAFILVGLALASARVAGADAARFPRMPSECAPSNFRSGGAEVRAALCRPREVAAAPVAIVLHGCGGFDTFDHRLAVELPAAGIATYYIDYFDPTPPPGRKGWCNGGGESRSGQNVFAVWQREVIDAAAHLRAVRGIDASRVALVGWSLGGGVAVGTALADKGRFQALVGFSTGFFGGPGDLSGMPPALLLSGGRHDAIPLAATRDLYQAFEAGGDKVSLYDYGNGVHSWPGAQGTAGIAVAERFLRRVLAPPPRR